MDRNSQLTKPGDSTSLRYLFAAGQSGARINQDFAQLSLRVVRNAVPTVVDCLYCALEIIVLAENTLQHRLGTAGFLVRKWSRISDYLAITTVVQELLSLGRSRAAAMRICSLGRSPRMIGQ